MKKWILRTIVVVAVLLVLGVVATALFLGSIVKKGVETIGPPITKTDIRLDSASISILSGSGSIKGFVLGNPQGYQTPQAIKVGTVELGVRPGSIFSDKVEVTHVRLLSPDITLETQGVNFMANNLNSILQNVQAAAGPDADKGKEPTKSGGAAKKLQVNEFLITGAKVNISSSLLSGKSASVMLSDIRLQNLGRGPEGITAAELTQVVMVQLVPAVLEAARTAISGISQQASDLIKGATGSTNVIEKAKGIGDLFKKK